MILGGLGLQRFGEGLGFPVRDWGLVEVVKAPDPSH